MQAASVPSDTLDTLWRENEADCRICRPSTYVKTERRTYRPKHEKQQSKTVKSYRPEGSLRRYGRRAASGRPESLAWDRKGYVLAAAAVWCWRRSAQEAICKSRHRWTSASASTSGTFDEFSGTQSVSIQRYCVVICGKSVFGLSSDGYIQ